MNQFPKDSAWVQAAHEAMKLSQLRREFEAKEEAALTRLKLLSGGVPTKGGGFVFTSVFRKGAVEYALIPQLRGVNTDFYRKPGIEVWNLEMELELEEVRFDVVSSVNEESL